LDLLTVVPYNSIRRLSAQKFSSANDDLKLVVDFVEKLLRNSGFVMLWHDMIVAGREPRCAEGVYYSENRTGMYR